MIEKLFSSPSVKKYQDLLRQGESVLVEELWDVTKAILAILTVQTTKKSVLLLTGGVREDNLMDNLSQLAPDLPVEFPAWETLPGEMLKPSPDVIGKRMEALYTLLNKKTPSIVLCPVAAFLQKVPAKEMLTFGVWKKKTRLPFGSIAEVLTNLGYRRETIVSDKGQFAIRGGIVDIFPVASPDPFRVEFFGDEIDQIRTFDPLGQKSIEKVDSFFLPPASELDLLHKASRLSSIVDFLQDPILFWDDLLGIEDAYVTLKGMAGAKSPFMFSFEEALNRINAQQVLCAPQKIDQLSEYAGRTFELMGRKFEATRFHHFFRKVEEEDYLQPEIPLVFLNANETEEAEMKKKLGPIEATFERGYLTSGFVLQDLPLAVIPNREITHKTRVRRQKWRGTTHTPAAEYHQLVAGDLVVHFHSGIGKYLGVEKQNNIDFMAIQYAESGKLYVPISQAYLVSKYIGTGDVPPPLNELGSKRWQTTRLNAQAQIVGYANDLLKIYAERVTHGGFKFQLDSDYLRQFELDFPYEATQDQKLAILAIKEDMVSSKAMDRLLCGDVGYGKTEVAMRAAFKAVVDGPKQVAVLVPTTVLAMQHFETFTERMSGFPVRVDVVSRFRTTKQIKETLQAVEEGKVDILIGTHRLLSKDVKFKDLGLLVIDEEQRFGVRSKEHLKKMKVGLDCLTMSATPIPRTLYMSLVGARDMSVIGTPPQDRLPIKAFLAEGDDELISNALMREFARGGQAFFIHNRVETIFERATVIQKLVPAAKIGVVHGQMDSDDIDAVFHNFKQGNLNLLFATTIIENGIDIPNANTILIDRADTHGLADLYQLRGRVGRWNRAAYAYFLIPKNARLPEHTRKRLNALVEASGFGGGMKIAMRDLEIRGAGDMLGVQQSGQVSSIGFHLYCKLLKKTVDSIKKHKPITFDETKIESSFDARIPETYIDDVSLRMELYYRFGEASTYTELDDLLGEMKDRFGPPPSPVLWLYHLARLRAFGTVNQFTLLKFVHATVTAEQKQGKELTKKTVVIPQQAQSPKDVEAHLTSLLKTHFSCTREPL
jgi:transcription-repair coupling factor (superfamily II helicase)